MAIKRDLPLRIGFRRYTIKYSRSQLLECQIIANSIYIFTFFCILQHFDGFSPALLFFSCF